MSNFASSPHPTPLQFYKCTKLTEITYSIVINSKVWPHESRAITYNMVLHLFPYVSLQDVELYVLTPPHRNRNDTDAPNVLKSGPALQPFSLYVYVHMFR